MVGYSEAVGGLSPLGCFNGRAKRVVDPTDQISISAGRKAVQDWISANITLVGVVESCFFCSGETRWLPWIQLQLVDGSEGFVDLWVKLSNRSVFVTAGAGSPIMEILQQDNQYLAFLHPANPSG